MFTARDHFAPHKSRKFEGYYTRTQLADGATLAIIFCWVKNAKVRSNYVLVSYSPPEPCSNAYDAPSADTNSTSTGTGADSNASLAPPRSRFTYEFFPSQIDVSAPNTKASSKTQKLPRDRDGHTPFTLSAPGIGHMTVTPDSIEYAVVVPEKHLRVHLTLDAHTPWSTSASAPLRGPMGGILRLSWGLPLNWHVRSTRSRATYYLAHGSSKGADSLRLEGVGRAHVEKNWGAAFPRGWLWAQAFSGSGDADGDGYGEVGFPGEAEDEDGDADEERTLCLAGGAALPGVQAYLVGYRSPLCRWDFRPPFTMALRRLSPFLQVKRDSVQGTVEITVGTWRRKLEVKMEAPPESFVGMAAPLRGGHEPGFAHESFRAVLLVEASRRKWPWGKWEVVDQSVLGCTAEGVRCGALEFGGSFYHGVRE